MRRVFGIPECEKVKCSRFMMHLHVEVHLSSNGRQIDLSKCIQLEHAPFFSKRDYPLRLGRLTGLIRKVIKIMATT